MWFLLPFGVFVALGWIGVLSLYPRTKDMARGLLFDEPGSSETKLAILPLVNPAILVLLGAAVGTLLADQVGLRSVLLDLARGRGLDPPGLFEAVLAFLIGLGIAAAIIIALSIAQWAAWLPPELATASAGGAGLLPGLLYGGMAEEIMVRFGLMTLLIWLLALEPVWDSPPTAAVVWVAIVLAALAFGLGHLPQVAMMTPLTIPVLLSIVGPNMVAGVAYGWLCWRTCLELGMLAHMATHIGFWLATMILPGKGPGLG